MSAHTAGPWRWELNEKSKEIRLCGGEPRFDLTVIDFARWGMDSAVVRFRQDVRGMNIMRHARESAAVVPGREHHAEWFKTLNHPDANLIAASPDLLAVVRAVLGDYEAIQRTRAEPYDDQQRAAMEVLAQRIAQLRAAIATAEGRPS